MPGLRQLGDQEADIVKEWPRASRNAAVLVDDPSTIRYHLERAYHRTIRQTGALLAGYPHRRATANIEPASQKGLRSAEDAPSWTCRKSAGAPKRWTGFARSSTRNPGRQLEFGPPAPSMNSSE